MLNFTFREYLRLNYYIVLKRKPMMILIGISLINLLCCILQVNGADVGYKDYDLVIWITFAALAALSLMIYNVSKKRYYANYGQGKSISYEFTVDVMSMKAEGFNAEFAWEKVEKVELLRNWVLIYTKGIGFNSIHKRSFTEEQLSEFLSIVKQHHIKIV